MRAPTLVPGTGTTTHLVLNDFGALGCAYLEADEAKVDEWTIVRNIANGHYSNPVRVVAFNVAEGWSRDVTRETLSSASSALLCSQRDDQSLDCVKIAASRNYELGL
jgi:hypothetical protein